jgi:hypothetical protein
MTLYFLFKGFVMLYTFHISIENCGPHLSILFVRPIQQSSQKINNDLAAGVARCAILLEPKPVQVQIVQLRPNKICYHVSRLGLPPYFGGKIVFFVRHCQNLRIFSYVNGF